MVCRRVDDEPAALPLHDQFAHEFARDRQHAGIRRGQGDGLSERAVSAPSAKSMFSGSSSGADRHSTRTSSPSIGAPLAGKRRKYRPATSLQGSVIGSPSTVMLNRSPSACLILHRVDRRPRAEPRPE